MGLSQTDRGLLESIWNTTSDPFESTNIINEWWELDDTIPSSDTVDSNFSNHNIFTLDEDVNSKKRKFPFAKDVPIPGNIAFQKKLMEILQSQRHKTDMKLHDEII